LKVVTARRFTPQEIKDRLQTWQLESICKDWLPDGKRQGLWWVTRCPWREDKKPSLGVSLTTGRWRDFASGERGDVFDLSMKLFGDSFSETIDAFADMLGMNGA
jgi:DNA primase